MKKIRIPFSIGDYQTGCYTGETRGDENHKPHPVRIFTVDLLSRYQTIVGAEKIENREVVGCWFNNGNFLSEDEENYQDLLLVKEEFEDGDIITTHGQVLNFIIPYRGTDNNGGVLTEVYCNRADLKINMHPYDTRVCGYTKDYCLATEEEKKTFFDVLEKVGKIWNAETKHIESIKPKYNLQPFDKVLVRDEKCQYWDVDIFSYRDSEEDDYSFHCLGGKKYDQCIPYNDETKYLLGTSYDAPEKYKN